MVVMVGSASASQRRQYPISTPTGHVRESQGPVAPIGSCQVLPNFSSKLAGSLCQLGLSSLSASVLGPFSCGMFVPCMFDAGCPRTSTSCQRLSLTTECHGGGPCSEFDKPVPNEVESDLRKTCIHIDILIVMAQETDI